MKEVNYAVIGLSGMGLAHITGITTDPRARLAAVCDIDASRRDEAAALQKGVRAYGDYRDVLASRDVDAVVIVVPDQLHREIAVAALAAGKHVLCEKPMALTLEDLRAMIGASRASDRKFMVGQICRFTPGFLAAKKLIDEGAIGELFYVESEYAHDYANILKPGSWRLDPLRHGFLGGGCHAVDLLRWIAGDPEEVSAFANRKMLADCPTDDCMIAIMKFPDDVIGKVFVSTGCKRNYTMRSAFYGSKGTIITDNTSPNMQVFRVDSTCGYTVPMLYPISISNHNTIGEIRTFTDCIVNDTPVPTDAFEGAKTVCASLAAIRASHSGTVEKIDYSVLEP